MNELRFGVGYNPVTNTFDMYLSPAEATQSGRRFAQSPEMVVVGEGNYTPPMLALRPVEAQTLLDELWRAGLRPKDGSGSAAQVEALRDHINDLRAIIASQLGVKFLVEPL